MLRFLIRIEFHKLLQNSKKIIGEFWKGQRILKRSPKNPKSIIESVRSRFEDLIWRSDSKKEPVILARLQSGDNPDFGGSKKRLDLLFFVSFKKKMDHSKRIKTKKNGIEREPWVRPWPPLSSEATRTHRASAILSWDNPIEGVDRVSRSECGDLLLVYPTGHMRTDFFTGFFSSWLNEPVI